ncbi:DotG/IcmE/VirB10 family protein [Mesorhizobium sp. SP-1A]|uniref:DotG/IcmE/VirB10 family protein n=1 Tax=Mesorhizobium sp. SP-1A TaxID=3077840 RepID=UPI0028F6F402|nr:DotG/IcmE/VirB10 family protein [Mesorhizobium sp. SP-1A]
MLKKLKGTTTGSRKMLLGLGAVVVGAVGYSIFSTSEVAAPNSSVSAPPNSGPTIQGGNPIPPQYDRVLAEADQERITEAKKDGISAMPTVRPNPSEQQIPVIDPDEPEEAAPEVELPEVKPPVVIQQQPLQTSIPIVQPPQQMRDPQETERLLDRIKDFRRPIAVAEVIQFTTNAAVQAEIDARREQSGPAASAADLTSRVGSAEQASKIKLPLAGTILYAELVSRANSDSPGPVLARILQGEYTGATLIGSFQTAQNSLIISFNKMTVKKTASGEEINETVPIETVAVDTKYIGTGLATKVDRHLFQKLAIGFTASFAEGFGDALANNGTTTVVTEGGSTISSRPKLNTNEQLLSAGGKAVSSAGSILMDEFGRRPTTVIVESGTAIGVLFL